MKLRNTIAVYYLNAKEQEFGLEVEMSYIDIYAQTFNLTKEDARAEMEEIIKKYKRAR